MLQCPRGSASGTLTSDQQRRPGAALPLSLTYGPIKAEEVALFPLETTHFFTSNSLLILFLHPFLLLPTTMSLLPSLSPPHSPPSLFSLQSPPQLQPVLLRRPSLSYTSSLPRPGGAAASCLPGPAGSEVVVKVESTGRTWEWAR